jgi:hypothetical protein
LKELRILLMAASSEDEKLESSYWSLFSSSSYSSSESLNCPFRISRLTA